MAQDDNGPGKKIQIPVEEKQRNVWWLFWAALGASLAAIVILSTAFFKGPYNMHDADFGIIYLALAIILGYAGYNRSVKWQCSVDERKSRRGGTIFGLIMAWGFGMYWLYQTKLTEHYFNKELVVPDHFTSFLMGVAAIFLGSKVVDLFDFRTRSKGEEAEDKG